MLTCRLEENYALLEVEEEAASHIKEGSFKDKICRVVLTCLLCSSLHAFRKELIRSSH